MHPCRDPCAAAHPPRFVCQTVGVVGEDQAHAHLPDLAASPGRPTCRPSRTRTGVLLRRCVCQYSPPDPTGAATRAGERGGVGRVARKVMAPGRDNGPLSRPGVRDSGLMRWSAPRERGSWLMYGDFGVDSGKKDTLWKAMSLTGAAWLSARRRWPRSSTPCPAAVCLDQLDSTGESNLGGRAREIVQAEFATRLSWPAPGRSSARLRGPMTTTTRAWRRGRPGWEASYPSRLEPACATVIAVGDRSCRTVKGILGRGDQTRGVGGACARDHPT